jgi:hypothetical protein
LRHYFNPINQNRQMDSNAGTVKGILGNVCSSNKGGTSRKGKLRNE